MEQKLTPKDLELLDEAYSTIYKSTSSRFLSLGIPKANFGLLSLTRKSQLSAD